MSVAALILGAGRGTRFAGGPKLLARLDGMALVRHVAKAAVGSRAEPVLLVTGHRADEVAASCAGLPLSLVPNPDYRDGLSTSLQAGFAALPAKAEAAIILLGDMPAVTSALIDRLIEAWRGGGRPPALVPTHAGQRGNPVLLSRALAPAIARLRGDVGAGPLLRGLAEVAELSVDDPAVALDIDTVEALANLGQVRTTPSSTAE